MLVGADGEVYFGFDDVIERLFVTLRFGTRFFGVQHVVRARLYLFHYVLRRTYAFERFNFHVGFILKDLPKS